METENKPLSQDQILFYENYGYLIIEAVLTNKECERLVVIAESHADPNFKGILDLETKDPSVLRLIKDGRIVRPVEILHHREMLCIGTQFLFKRPGSDFAEQAWNPHQDNSYVRAPYGKFVSAIIPLVDSDPENGGMYIYPGSHKECLLPCEPMPSFNPKLNPGNCIKEIPPQYKEEPLYMKRGALYIQHGNLIHGSYPNRSENRPRPHFGIMYIAKGEPYTLGNTRRKFKPIELH